MGPSTAHDADPHGLSDAELHHAIHHMEDDLDDDEWDESYKHWIEDKHRLQDLMREAWSRWGWNLPLCAGALGAGMFGLGYAIGYDWYDTLNLFQPGLGMWAISSAFQTLNVPTALVVLVAAIVTVAGGLVANRAVQAKKKDCDAERAAVAAAQAALKAAQDALKPLAAARAAADTADQKAAAAQAAADAASKAAGAKPWSLDATVTDLPTGDVTEYHRKGTGYRDSKAKASVKPAHDAADQAAKDAKAAHDAFDAAGGAAALQAAQAAVAAAQAALTAAEAALAKCLDELAPPPPPPPPPPTGGATGGTTTSGSDGGGGDGGGTTHDKGKKPPPPPPPPDDRSGHTGTKPPPEVEPPCKPLGAKENSGRATSKTFVMLSEGRGVKIDIVNESRQGNPQIEKFMDSLNKLMKGGGKTADDGAPTIPAGEIDPADLAGWRFPGDPRGFPQLFTVTVTVPTTTRTLSCQPQKCCTAKGWVRCAGKCTTLKDVQEDKVATRNELTAMEASQYIQRQIAAINRAVQAAADAAQFEKDCEQ